MAGNSKNKWLPQQVTLLERLISFGISYETAAGRVGHSAMSCRTKISELRSAKRRAEQQKPGEIARAMPSRLPFDAPIAKRPLAPLLQTHLNDAAHTRTTSTANLVMDAELRSRIEVQGVTAGLLGDPMPGRSALDRKRAGEVESPTWMDGRAARFIPKITLATGPLR
jgi:hypothetical protein